MTHAPYEHTLRVVTTHERDNSMTNSQQPNSFQIKYLVQGRERVVRVYSGAKETTAQNWIGDSGWINFKAEYASLELRGQEGKKRWSKKARYGAYHIMEKRWSQRKGDLTDSDKEMAMQLIKNIEKFAYVAEVE